MAVPPKLTLWQWFKGLFTGPHLIIEKGDPDYIRRWYLIPRNPYFNIYLHRFGRGDDARAMHDHPWWNISIVLKNGYVEEQWNPRSEKNEFTVVQAPAICLRKANTRHRIICTLENEPTWTLFVTGKNKRNWGFWCDRDKFIPHQEWGRSELCN